MTQFSSKTPRDLNHDPQPYIGLYGDHVNAAAARWEGGRPHAPRPEFDHPQHNEPNPILVSFRANDQNPDPAQWAEWLRLPSLGPWHYARRDHIDHARRVFLRLAGGVR